MIDSSRKEWESINSNLEDFVVDGIPSSQTSIQWNESDDDDSVQFNSTSLKPIPVIKNKYTSIMYDEWKGHTIYKNSNNTGNDNVFSKVQISPVFKRRVAGVSRKSNLLNITTFDKFYTGNYDSSNLELESMVYSNLDREEKDYIKRNSSTFTKTDLWEKTYSGFKVSRPSSPILISKRKYFDDKGGSICEGIRKSITSSCMKDLCVSNTINEPPQNKEDFNERSQYIEFNSCSNKIESEELVKKSLSMTAEEYDLDQFDSRVFENEIPDVIGDNLFEGSFSPSIGFGKNFNLVKGLSDEASIADDPSSHEYVSSQLEEPKKGSEWLKVISHLTPEKVDSVSTKLDCYIPNPPDSTQKKVKRDGLAESFKRLHRSWHSDISIWVYEMNQALIAESFKINQSPNVLNMKFNSPMIFLKKENSVKEEMLNIKIPDLSARKYFNLPCQKCSNKVDSLELNSPSSVGSSLSHINFSIPKKFVKLNIIKVCNGSLCNSTLIECEEIWHEDMEIESAKSIDIAIKKLPEFTLLKYAVFLGQFSQLQEKDYAKIGDEIKIYPPWQVLQNKSYPMPCLFSSHYIWSKCSK